MSPHGEAGYQLIGFCSGVIWIGSFDNGEDFADAVFEFLAGLLFGLDFFFSLLLFGTEDRGKEGWFPILRHGCGSPGVKVLRASPGCLTVSFSSSGAGTAMNFFLTRTWYPGFHKRVRSFPSLQGHERSHRDLGYLSFYTGSWPCRRRSIGGGLRPHQPVTCTSGMHVHSSGHGVEHGRQAEL